jgi:hypothetical protein
VAVPAQWVVEMRREAGSRRARWPGHGKGAVGIAVGEAVQAQGTCYIAYNKNSHLNVLRGPNASIPVLTQIYHPTRNPRIPARQDYLDIAVPVGRLKGSEVRIIFP